MSSFVRLDWLDPYQLLASKIKLSRHAMRTSYDSAFTAFRRCHELLKEELWTEFPGSPLDWFMAMTTGEPEIPTVPREQIRDYHYEAQVEDSLADHQSSIVLLFADDALQNFARGVLGKAHRSLDSYGPRYPDAKTHTKPVALTTLVRAGTNAIRHVSEWDDPSFPYPYPEIPHCKKRGCRVCQALPSIDAIQRAFGIGMHGRIQGVVSMRTLILVDGLLGTSEPEYARFENAMITVASEIAEKAGGDASAHLTEALAKVASK